LRIGISLENNEQTQKNKTVKDKKEMIVKSDERKKSNSFVRKNPLNLSHSKVSVECT